LGGIYLYANQQGCDGERLYYDGSSLVALNGRIVSQGSQFSLNEVEVTTATLDLEAVRAHRTSSSRRMQAAQAEPYQRVWIDFRLDGGKGMKFGEEESKVGEFKYHSPEEEIAWVPRTTGEVHADVQAGSGVLDVGLPATVSHPGILPAAEWRY
jgi:NAD+ synthase (glutamine-hydrolysing)